MQNFTYGNSLLGGTAISTVMDMYVSSYVSTWTRVIAARARELCKAKHVVVDIRASTFPGSDRGIITVTQQGGEPPYDKIEYWAFDTKIPSPPGGIQPPRGQTSFKMYKPEGIVFRTRTYTQDKEFVRVGYLSEAIRRTFTQEELDRFGIGFAQLVGSIVQHKIKEMFESRGFNVETH